MTWQGIGKITTASIFNRIIVAKVDGSYAKYYNKTYIKTGEKIYNCLAVRNLETKDWNIKKNPSDQWSTLNQEKMFKFEYF